MLNNSEINRYQRQLLLEDFGEKSQIKLKNSSVLVVGAGGLGCPVLLYLASAGVGKIGIVDDDVIDESNLQRQILFDTLDVGKAKVEIAQKKLTALNPNCEIAIYKFRLNSTNTLDIFKEYDLIIDGSDNFPTRYLVNDACLILNKPFVSGAIYKFEGQVGVFNHNSSANYRDLFPNPPSREFAPNCQEAGVIGSIAGIVGTLMATEAIKILSEVGEVLSNKLLAIDTLSFQFKTLKFFKDKTRNPIEKLIDYELFCNAPSSIEELDFESVCDLLNSTKNKVTLIDVRTKLEHEIENIGGLSIPLESLEHNMLKFEHSETLIFYCQSGKRSLIAAEKMSKILSSKIVSLKGGMNLLPGNFEELLPH